MSQGNETAGRRAARSRRTKETAIEVVLDVDGTGEATIATGIPFFDHMVSQLGRHGGFDLTVTATGDLEVDTHHTVEDVGITLGAALAEALGDRAGIRRFASIALPLDEALVEVAPDPPAPPAPSPNRGNIRRCAPPPQTSPRSPPPWPS